MKYKALTTFSGAVNMVAGEVRELTDKAVIDDLLHAGYIAQVEAKASTKGKAVAKKKTAKK